MTDWRRPIGRRRVELPFRRTAVFAELPVKGSAAKPTRRRSLAGLLAAAAALLAACSGNSSYFSSTRRLGAAGRAAGAGDDARHRPGQGRADLAAVGARQCRRRRPGHAQRRRNGAGRIQCAQHPAAGERRRRQRRRRARRRAAGARRRRRDHSRAAVRAVGQPWSGRWRARATFRSSRFRPTPMSLSHGVYLLSFLPESDVERIVQYAASTGKRSSPR